MTQFFRVDDMFDFDNASFSHTVNDRKVSPVIKPAAQLVYTNYYFYVHYLPLVAIFIASLELLFLFNVQYLACADCEVGPMGYHNVNTKHTYIAIAR